MSKIKTLSARNLKGLTFSHELAAVNIVSGANYSGKTAILTSIRLALQGYDAKLGKTNTGIFDACGCPGGGATELAVHADLDDGAVIDRQWSMKRGKISYTGPEESYIPPLLLDPTTYFSMTGPARLNYVLSQCDLAALGLGCDALLDTMKPVLFPLALTSDAGKEASIIVHTKITELEAARAEEDASIYDWMVQVVEEITKLRDGVKKEVDTHEKTIKGMTTSKADDNDMSAIQSVQPQINEARAKLEEAVRAEANALTTSLTAQRDYQKAFTLASTAVDETAAQTNIQAQEAIIAEAGKVPAPGEPPQAQQMPTERPSCVGEMASKSVIQAHADTALRAEAKALDAVNDMKAKIQAARDHTTCPTCGHDITEKQTETIKTLESQLATAEAKHKTAQETAEHNASALVLATSTFNAAEANCKAWDTAKATLDSQNQQALAQWNEKTRKFNAAQAQINEANAKITQIRAGLAGNAHAAAARASLPTLDQAAKDAVSAHQSAGQPIRTLKEQIGQLEAKQRQFVARTQDQKRFDQSQASLKVAREKLDVYKAALKLVAGEKDRVSQAAFDSLLAKARLFTDGLIRSPLEYHNDEIGRTEAGNWVSWKVFSGFESLVAFMGLGVALTQTHKGIKIVLADEAGVCDAGNKAKLVCRLLELTQTGVIDQAVLCDVSDAGYPTADGLKIIRVDAPAAPTA